MRLFRRRSPDPAVRLDSLRVLLEVKSVSRSRYALRYFGSGCCLCLEGLREPPGSCKLLQSITLGMAWKRSSDLDPDQATSQTAEDQGKRTAARIFTFVLHKGFYAVRADASPA